MASSSLDAGQIGPPPFPEPVVQSFDRMKRRLTMLPEQLTALACSVLLDRYGSTGHPVEAAFAHGAVGLLAGHTHYFDGFAMLMPLAQGVAVAFRDTEAAASRLVMEGHADVWSFDQGAGGARRPVEVQVVEAVVRRLAPAGVQVEGAVVGTLPPACADARLAALAVATARAMQALFALPADTDALLRLLHEELVACLKMPFSPAFLIAAEAGRPGYFHLVDVATSEHLPVEAPPLDVLGWGLVDVGSGLLYKPVLHRGLREKADAVLAALQRNGFDHLTSLRDLEHRDLERALKAAPRRSRTVLRHLVTENGRVQKLVAAARRMDWQLFGALLLMSHASLRDDWRRTSAEVDFVVAQAEGMSLDGIYGACVTGRGGCVLVIGLPFVVPTCLQRLADAFEQHFGKVPETVLL